MIDVDSKSIQLQPENGLVMKKWTGNLHDNLIELANFLLSLVVTPLRHTLYFVVCSNCSEWCGRCSASCTILQGAWRIRLLRII